MSTERTKVDSFLNKDGEEKGLHKGLHEEGRRHFLLYLLGLLNACRGSSPRRRTIIVTGFSMCLLKPVIFLS